MQTGLVSWWCAVEACAGHHRLPSAGGANGTFSALPTSCDQPFDPGRTRARAAVPSGIELLLEGCRSLEYSRLKLRPVQPFKGR